MIPFSGQLFEEGAKQRAANATDKWRRRTRRLEKLLYRAYVALEDSSMPTLAADIRNALEEKLGRPGPKRKT
jgi:hypothetical protein